MLAGDKTPEETAKLIRIKESAYISLNKDKNFSDMRNKNGMRAII